MSLINPEYVYFSWNRHNACQALTFLEDNVESVQVSTSCGPYKNSFGDIVFQKNHVYYWSIKLIKGNYFKIGVIKESDKESIKNKAFSDLATGYSFFTTGAKRNNSNKPVLNEVFLKPAGPGDVVGVKFDTRKGTLSFQINGGGLKEAYTSNDFKKGGYVAAVAALIQGSKFSFHLPLLED